ncbi:MAG: polysaccharide biosynthesis tyrosine autokinase [Opitutales bacterium]|nr:polysaccharide biosynthesis tyrosine autokinase [Opitutales bacterium]
MDDDFLNDSEGSAVGNNSDLGDTIRKMTYRLKSLLSSYWWILLLSTTLGFAMKALQVRKMTDSYVSTAQLMIQGQIEIDEGDRMREVASNFHQNQLHLMLRPWVKNRAIERVRALHPEIEKGGVKLNASRKGTTDVFLLSAVGEKPVFTQYFLDEAIEAYLESRRQARMETSDNVMLSIDEELRELDVEIEQTQRDIRRFQEQTNTAAIQEMSVSAAANLTRVNAQMEDYRTELRILESFDENASLDQIQDVVNLEALQSTQSYRDTKRQYQSLIAMRDTLGVYLKPKHPKMIDINSDLELLGNRLDVIRRQAFEQMDDQKASIRTRIATLQPQLDKWRGEVIQYKNKVNEYENLTSKLDRLQQTQDRLIRRKEALDIGRGVDTELVSRLHNATPAVLRKVDKPKEVATGCVIGFMLGCGIVALLAVLNNKITTADDIRNQFDGKVVGLIPKAKGRVTLIKKESNHVFAEAFRSLRSSILMHSQESQNKSKVILVTSCAPAEGKSTVSSNLAAILAYSGAKTLLVDCDLRRGHLHDKFGISREPGLAELLENSFLDIGEITLTGDKSFQNLSVITAGRANDNPGDLFLIKRMDEILDRCREQFDYIVLDTAPILAVDDTIGLLKRADDIVFVTKSSQTTFRQLRLALDRISVTKRKVWGFVINYVSSSGADYYYYSRYKSYRYHQEDAGKVKRKASADRKKSKISLT